MTKLLPIGLALAAALFLSACGLSEADVQATVSVAEANAIATVYAQFTQVALLTPSATNTLAATSTPAITNTPLPAATTGTGPGGGTTACHVMTFFAEFTLSD